MLCICRNANCCRPNVAKMETAKTATNWAHTQNACTFAVLWKFFNCTLEMASGPDMDNIKCSHSCWPGQLALFWGSALFEFWV